jgi:aspartyl-tRNA(Asn)/glutamyl-tRNA(Gln) amidotransferase subunit B
MGTIKSYLNENAIPIEEFRISPQQIAKIISLVDEGKVSNTVASQNIFPALIAHPDKEPLTIAQENNWIQESNTDVLLQLVKQAIQNIGNEKVMEYKKGKKGLVGLFMGEVMKLSKGKADPKEANRLLLQTLDNI